MRTLVVAAITLALHSQLALAGPDAASDPAAARQRAAAADAAAARGENHAALALYQQALELDDSPRYRCNVGIAYYKLRDWPRSHLLLAQCLAHAAELDAGAVSQMGRAYAFVERQLEKGRFSQVSITTAPKARLTISALGSDESFASPRTVWLPHGKHRVRATRKGYLPAVQELELGSSRELVTVQLTLREKVRTPPAELDAQAERPDSPAGHEFELPVFTPDPALGVSSRKPVSRAPAWISFAVAGGALLAGASFHKLALDASSEAVELSAGDDFNRADRRFKRHRIAAIGLYAVSALAVASGAYFWSRGSPSREQPALGLSLHGPGATVSTAWSF